MTSRIASLAFGVSAALTAASCSLLVDVEGVRARRDAGIPGTGGGTSGVGGGGVGGGSGGAGGSDGGTDGGGGGGLVRCQGSFLQNRMRCGAPIPLGSGSNVREPVASSNATSFLATWISNGRVEARAVGLDGSVSTLVSSATAGPSYSVIGGRGQHWAVAWVAQLGTTVKCIASASDAGVVDVATAVSVDLPAIAVFDDGGVALAAQNWTTSAAPYNTFHAAVDEAGCPPSLFDFSTAPVAISNWGTSAVAFRGSPEARFTVFGRASSTGSSGSGRVYRVEPDGGYSQSPAYGISGLGPDFHYGALGANNGTISVAMRVRQSDGSDGLVATAVQTDQTSFSPLNVRLVSDVPPLWGIAPCGAGCMAIAWMPKDVSPGNLRVDFFSDDLAVTPRGAYDAVCQVATGSGGVAVGNVGNKLGILYTTPTAASMYICDVPALP